MLLAERPLVIAEGASATKSSATDPVTRADIAARQVITEIIVKARPSDAIFGEEGLDTSRTRNRKSAARSPRSINRSRRRVSSGSPG